MRNAQLDLTREQVKLQEDELELSHQLAYAVRDLETDYVLMDTAFNRRKAAEDQLKADEAIYESGAAATEEGTPILNDLLRAQQEFSQAESDYYRAVVNYNKAIAQVHYRKGSLLEYNGVYLAEGPWPGKAYFDARRRSRARDGFDVPRLRLHAAEGDQPRADRTRTRTGRRARAARCSRRANCSRAAKRISKVRRRRRRRSPSRCRFRTETFPAEPVPASPTPEPTPERTIAEPPQAGGGDQERQCTCRPNGRRRAGGSRRPKGELRQWRQYERLAAAGEPIEGRASG